MKNNKIQTQLSNKTLSIVCVVANEKDSLKKFVNEVLEKCNIFKSVKLFLIFDDVDKDGTKHLAKMMSKKDKRVIFLECKRSKNVVETLLFGYSNALKSKADFILDINAGYRHLPSDLEKFFLAISPNYDCFFGSRFISGGSMSAPSIKRKIYSMGGTYLANFLLGTDLTDMTSGFQLYRRKVIKDLLSIKFFSKYHFINTEIKFYCKNFNILEIPISYETPASSVKFYVLLDSLFCLCRVFCKRFSKKKLIKC